MSPWCGLLPRGYLLQANQIKANSDVAPELRLQYLIAIVKRINDIYSTFPLLLLRFSHYLCSWFVAMSTR
jgi:hypothetical protein